jgi:hypothetical protein
VNNLVLLVMGYGWFVPYLVYEGNTEHPNKSTIARGDQSETPIKLAPPLNGCLLTDNKLPDKAEQDQEVFTDLENCLKRLNSKIVVGLI